MDLFATTLLPSQESLLQRLQHLASFNSQLYLLCGVAGAGKTQILTALAEHCTGKLVWLSCPKHAKPQEIRRKLLVQICSDSIFDDEQSLVHTLGRLKNQQHQNFHLLIDDADNLSAELWAELLVLSQLQVAGLQLAFTLSCHHDFAKHMLAQLTRAQQSQLVLLQIPPLTFEERVALYRMLSSRREALPQVTRQQMQNELSKQAGTPNEVVSWLSLQLLPTPSSGFKRGAFILPVFVVIAALMSGYWWLEQQTKQLTLPVTNLFSLSASASISSFAAPLIAKITTPYVLAHIYPAKDNKPAFAVNYVVMDGKDLSLTPLTITPKLAHAELIQTKALPVNVVLVQGIPVETVQTKVVQTKAIDAKAVQNKPSEPELIKSEISQASLVTAKSDSINIVTLESKPKPAVTIKEPQIKAMSEERDPVASTEVVAPVLKAEPRANQKSEPELKETLPSAIPKLGYTLQLATLNNAASAKTLMQGLSSPQVAYLVAEKQWQVLLLGQFDSYKQALAYGDQLVKQYGIAKPGVRSWKNLQTLAVKPL
ncbi:MAG: AAA family ATPase [Shewanella sp.]